MTVKRINYSGRVKLSREQADITVWPSTASKQAAYFDAHFDLSRLVSTAWDARVFVEAYHRSVRVRFDFGSVANIIEPPAEKRSLVDFTDWRDVQFRVKVTAVSGSPGKMIAWADRIKPRGTDVGNEADLVRFRDDDLIGRLWDMEFDEQGPIVLVDRSQGGAQTIGRAEAFRATAYPEILRRALIHALIIEEASVEDDDHWLSLWYDGFLKPRLKLAPPPAERISERFDWINNAVTQFCNKLQIARRWQGQPERS